MDLIMITIKFISQLALILDAQYCY